jgi:probable lipoprotein NlpC
MTHWTADLIGLPFKGAGRERTGCDCYGLMVLDYAALGIALRTYDGEIPDYGTAPSRDDRATIARLLAAGEANPDWRRVELSEARPHDALIFARGALDTHLGIFVDARRMLHTNAVAGQSRIEAFDPRKVAAVFRHRELEALT